MNWIKKILRKWIGIDENKVRIDQLFDLYSDLTNIGIDVHFREPHMILIFSKLKGGQIRHIEADFKDLRELEAFSRELKNRFRPKDIFWDKPHGWIL